MELFCRRFTIGPALLILGMMATGCTPLAAPGPVATPAPTTVARVAPLASTGDATGSAQMAAYDVTATGTSTPAPTVPTATKAPPTAGPSATAPPSPAPPEPTPTRTTTATPSPSTTPLPATAVPAPTVPKPLPPTIAPAPTRTSPPPAPAPSPHRFLPAGPVQADLTHLCPGCGRAPAFIVGRVVDAAGNPLAGVRLVCYNEWHRYPVVASKGGGEYDFNINQAETTWYVVVVDEADQPISAEAAVPFNPAESCRYILNWQQATGN